MVISTSEDLWNSTAGRATQVVTCEAIEPASGHGAQGTRRAEARRDPPALARWAADRWGNRFAGGRHAAGGFAAPRRPRPGGARGGRPGGHAQDLCGPTGRLRPGRRVCAQLLDPTSAGPQGRHREQEMSETFQTTIDIVATQEQVFDYFVRPELLVRWMGDFARLEAKAGGVFSVDINGVLIRGHFVRLQRPNLIEIAWGEAGNGAMPPGAT